MTLTREEREALKKVKRGEPVDRSVLESLERKGLVRDGKLTERGRDALEAIEDGDDVE